MEQIVFVKENGQPTGKVGPKLASHTNSTKLHLAFSCYVVDESGKLLVTKRAATKKVWPSFWTNSVCGHPSPGESLISAIQRRLGYELGMKASDFTCILPNYRYQTPAYNNIIENEFCPVFFARMQSRPQPNPDEVSDIDWVSWNEFVSTVEADSDDYRMFEKEISGEILNTPQWSWWCKDQLKQLKDNPLIRTYVETTSF